MTNYTTVLSIAGSDSIGGAGIQADIKTIEALGCYAMTVITAVTAQNTRGVKRFEAVSPELLEEQLAAVFDDVVPDGVKVGMLPNASSIEIVGRFLSSRNAKNVVVDPVMVATSGDRLTSNETGDALKKFLFPVATVVTPNLSELKILTENSDIAGLLEICPGLLVKGGHGPGDELTDTLYIGPDKKRQFSHKKIVTDNTHGTGCTLSSAIASFLALGFDLEMTVERGIDWLQIAIEKGSRYKLGEGHGPVEHNFSREITIDGYKI